MRIAFVTTLQPETHYSRWLLEELIKLLPKSDRLFIYCEKDRKNQGLFPNLKLAFNQDKRFPGQIAEAVLKDKIELLHIQHEINMFGGAKTAYLFPGLLKKLKEANVKIIVTFHGVVGQDQIDSEFLRTFSLPSFSALVRLVKLFFRYLFGRSAQWIDLALVHSEFSRQILINDYGYKNSQTQVVRLGVPTKKIEARISKLEIGNCLPAEGSAQAGKLEILKNATFVLYFGYILKRKGLEYLLEAWQKIAKIHPDWKLVLAGGTLDYQKKYAEDLQKKIENSSLKNNVIFTGFLAEDDLVWLYQNCQFLVLPYTLSISSSLPLSFAIEHQKPVIATSIGTLKEEVKDNKTGLLVSPESSQALFQAISKLIESPSLLKKLSQGQAQEKIERSWAKVAQQTLNLYQQIGG